MDRLNDLLRSGGGGLSEFDAALGEARRARCAAEPEAALAAADRARGLATYSEQAADAEFERARALILLKRYDEARAVLQKLERESTGARPRTQANIGLGELAEATSDMNEARTRYEAAVTQTRGASSVGFGDMAALARGLLAAVALRDGGARYADHLLKEAFTLLPDNADSGLRGWLTGLRGEAAFGNGQDSEGRSLLESALLMSSAARCRADARRWAQLLGGRALDEGRVDDAHSAYFRALSLYPPNTVSADYVDAVIGMSRAELVFRETRLHEEALAHAQIALKAALALNDPARISRAHGALGEALKALGRSPEAVEHLQAAVEGGATLSLSARRALAAALFESGEQDKALEAYQATVTLADRGGTPLERASIRRDFGLARWRANDPAGAITVWTAAIPLYEEANALAQAARLHCDIAHARRATGARTRAVKDIEQALMLLNALDRQDAETRGLVLANAAMIYAEGADAESADSFFKESIELASSLNDPLAHSTRLGNYGWFLLLIGRPRRAQATLEQALTVSRENHLTLQEAVQIDNLGLVFDNLGEYPRALEMHEQALTLADDAHWLAVIRVNTANTLMALNRYEDAASLVMGALESARGRNDQEALVMALTAQGHYLMSAGQLDGAAGTLEEALAIARKIDQRRLLAEALSQRSRLEARRGMNRIAADTWEEAKKLYLLLHMPQGKLSPDWL